MPKTATKTAPITAKTKLGEVLKRKPDAVLDVLANFGLIHCEHCEVDESQTIEAACKEHGAPAGPVVKAIAAAVK